MSESYIKAEPVYSVERNRREHLFGKIIKAHQAGVQIPEEMADWEASTYTFTAEQLGCFAESLVTHALTQYFTALRPAGIRTMSFAQDKDGAIKFIIESLRESGVIREQDEDRMQSLLKERIWSFPEMTLVD